MCAIPPQCCYSTTKCGKCFVTITFNAFKCQNVARIWTAFPAVNFLAAHSAAAVIHSSSCRNVHDNIKQMKKCDVACSCLEPSLSRVHTDIKWSDDNCQLANQAADIWTLLDVNRNNSRGKVKGHYYSWKTAESYWYVDVEMYINIYIVMFICF